MWAALAPVLKVLLQAILPFLWEKLNAPTIAEDSVSDPVLRKLLRERVREARRSGTAG